jgi:hypothetical protein
MLIYIATFAGVFAVLIFLKFCEGSPIRSWLAVFLVGLPLAGALGWYFNHAFPQKGKPLPQSAKADAYRLELERTFRRIDGVDNASFKDKTIEMNFRADKPTADLRQIALDSGGAAAWFVKTNGNSVQITVHMTVQGRDRYEMTYDTAKGLIDQHEY